LHQCLQETIARKSKKSFTPDISAHAGSKLSARMG
jgi:hypothetical protein